MNPLPDITLPAPDLARALAAEGAPPDDVERAIAAQRPWLDSEHRAAIWLLAWCTAGREKPRAVASVPPGG
jgi:hypothetical protein